MQQREDHMSLSHAEIFIIQVRHEGDIRKMPFYKLLFDPGPYFMDEKN